MKVMHISKKIIQEKDRLKKEYEQKLNDTKKSTEKSLIPLLYESNKQFQGIINYLQKNYNINDELNITSSPVLIESTDSPKNTILYNSTKFLRTIDVKNAFICFDFRY